MPPAVARSTDELAAIPARQLATSCGGSAWSGLADKLVNVFVAHVGVKSTAAMWAEAPAAVRFSPHPHPRLVFAHRDGQTIMVGRVAAERLFPGVQLP